MKITNTQNSHLIIDEFFNPTELQSIWSELEEITNGDTLLPPNKTATATDGVKPIKHNHGVFLDDLFQKGTSKIINTYDKFYSKDVFEIFSNMSSEFRHMFSVNFDRTLVSYYENEDFYKQHIDAALFTCLWWGCKEPKKFEGGDLELNTPNGVVYIPFTNNRLILFPSYLVHSVSSVKMIDDSEPFSKNGRYCITRFLFVQPTTGK